MYYLEQHQDHKTTIHYLAHFQQHYISYASELGQEITIQHQVFTSETECVQFTDQKLKQQVQLGYKDTALLINFPKVQAKNLKAFQNQCREAFLHFYVQHSIFSGDLNHIESLIQKIEVESPKFIKTLFKSIQKFWLEYQYNSIDPLFFNEKNRSGYRAKINQSNLIFILACKFLKESDISSQWAYMAQSLVLVTVDPKIQQLALQLQPEWFNKFLKVNLKHLTEHNAHLHVEDSIHYDFILALEKLGFVTFEEQVYAELIPRLRMVKVADETLSTFLNNELAHSRDIPFILSQDVNFKIKNYSYYSWHGEDFWVKIIQHLDTHQKLDRLKIFQLLLEAQIKDWKVPTKALHKKILMSMQPRIEELIYLQADLFRLLACEYPASVLFAVEQCKLLLEHPDFQLYHYLNILNEISQNEYISSAIKLIFNQLKKLTENIQLAQSDQVQQIVEIHAHLLKLSPVNLQNDIATEMVKMTAKFAQNINFNVIDEKIDEYQSYFKGRTASILSEINIQHPSSAEPKSQIKVSYQYQPIKIKHLEESLPLETTYTWDNFLSVCQTIRNFKKLYSIDQFFSIWLKLGQNKPDDYKTQLDLFIRRLLCPTKSTFLSRFQLETWCFLNHTDDLGIYAYLDYYVHDKDFVQTWNGYIQAFKFYVEQNANMEMLALPTHAPSYIDAATLVERLIQYEKQQIQYHATDLSIAIARLPDQDFRKALKLTEQLKDPQLKLLLSCALDPKFEFNSLNASQLKEINQSNDLISLWTTAYLTRHPDATIVSDQQYLPERCKIESDFHPQPYRFTQKEIYDHKRGQYFTKSAVHLEVPANTPLTQLEIYTNQIKFYGLRQFDQHLLVKVSDFDHLFHRHISPINSIWLDFNIAANCCFCASKLPEDTTRLFEYWTSECVNLSCYTIFILCSYLHHATEDLRNAATRILIQKIAQQSIDIRFITQHCSILVQAQYAPINRLLASFEMIYASSALHQQVMLQIIEAILEELEVSEHLISEATKLFDVYDRFIHELDHPPSTSILQKLQFWSELKPKLKTIAKRMNNFKPSLHATLKPITIKATSKATSAQSESLF